MKSILLYVNEEEGMEARLQAALDIARASGGHITCLYVVPIAVGSYVDVYGTAYMLREVISHAENQAEKIRDQISKKMMDEDVPWNFIVAKGDVADRIARHSSLEDIIVLSRPKQDVVNYKPITLFGDLLHQAGTPILIQPPNQMGIDPTGPAVVAWNGSIEAGHALRAALPMLKMSSAVHIVVVEEDKDHDFPPLDASKYLSRHEIDSEIHSRKSKSKHVEDVLVSTAESLKASYIVMGGFGHSRAREYVFGGVTRDLLKDCTLPILLAH